MAIGPGKYDELAVLALDYADAEGAIVIVLGGNRGSAFAQAWRALRDPSGEPARILDAARAVRQVADTMEADAARLVAAADKVSS